MEGVKPKVSKVRGKAIARNQATLMFGVVQALFAIHVVHALAFATKAQQQQQQQQQTEKDLKLLFLGNSYVHRNNLDVLTKHLLEAGLPELDGRVEVYRRAPGGERFSGHLNAIIRKNANSNNNNNQNEKVQQWLMGDNAIQFQWIILQEQSQIPGFYSLGKRGGGANQYEKSRHAAVELNKLCAENGAQTLFLMTWGRRSGDIEKNPVLYSNYTKMQNYLTEGYMRYVKVTSTEQRPTYVAPAGLVFQSLYQDALDKRDVDLGKDLEGSLFYDLFVDDGSHPSLAGSYLTALTIYTTVTGMNPKDVNWYPPKLDPEICALIQDAVSRTILSTYHSKTIKYPWKTPWTTNFEKDEL